MGNVSIEMLGHILSPITNPKDDYFKKTHRLLCSCGWGARGHIRGLLKEQQRDGKCEWWYEDKGWFSSTFRIHCTWHTRYILEYIADRLRSMEVREIDQPAAV